MLIHNEVVGYKPINESRSNDPINESRSSLWDINPVVNSRYKPRGKLARQTQKIIGEIEETYETRTGTTVTSPTSSKNT